MQCLCLLEISINVNKLIAVLLLPVYFLIPFFILMLLPYFCLFVDHVNKPIIFVFGIFVYHFKNITFMFVTIYSEFHECLQKCLQKNTIHSWSLMHIHDERTNNATEKYGKKKYFHHRYKTLESKSPVIFPHSFQYDSIFFCVPIKIIGLQVSSFFPL